jgi:hypothetical protein
MIDDPIRSGVAKGRGCGKEKAIKKEEFFK